jgi:hypothetical protein
MGSTVFWLVTFFFFGLEAKTFQMKLWNSEALFAFRVFCIILYFVSFILSTVFEYNDYNRKKYR